MYWIALVDHGSPISSDGKHTFVALINPDDYGSRLCSHGGSSPSAAVT
jgi:hypothetical protein